MPRNNRACLFKVHSNTAHIIIIHLITPPPPHRFIPALLVKLNFATTIPLKLRSSNLPPFFPSGFLLNSSSYLHNNDDSMMTAILCYLSSGVFIPHQCSHILSEPPSHYNPNHVQQYVLAVFPF